MPTDVATLAIEVTSDSVTAATQRLGQLPGAATQAEQAITKVGTAASAAGSSAEAMSDHIERLSATLAQETVTASEASAATAKMAPAEAEVTSATAELETQLAGLKAEMAEIGGSATGAVAGLGAIRSTMVSLRSTLLAGGLFIGVGAELGKLAYDFDAAMTKISGLTDLGTEHVNEFKAAIRDLSIGTGTSQVDLANALYFIGSAGQNATQALDTLNIAAQASEIGLGTAEGVARALATTMNAYAASSISAAQAGDVLVAATKAGAVSVDELAPALGRVLPIAAAMGVSLNDATAAVAAMTRQGLSAAQSVTALRSELLEIEKPSTNAVKALQSASDGTLTFQQMADELAKPGGLLIVLEQLNKLFGNNAEEMAKVFPNLRALVGVSTELGAHMGDTVKVFGEVEGASGSLSTAVDRDSNSASIAFRQHWEAIRATAQDVGGVLLTLANSTMNEFGNEVSRQDEASVKWLDTLTSIWEKIQSINANRINLDSDGNATFGNPAAKTTSPLAAGRGRPDDAFGAPTIPTALATDPTAGIHTSTPSELATAGIDALIAKQKDYDAALNGGAEAMGLYQARQKITTELEKAGITVTDQNRAAIEAKTAALGHAIAIASESKASTREDHQFDSSLAQLQSRIDMQNALNAAMFSSKDIQAGLLAEQQAVGELQSRNIAVTSDQGRAYLALADSFEKARQSGALLGEELRNESDLASTYEQITTGLSSAQRKQSTDMDELLKQYTSNPAQFGVQPGDTADFASGLAQIQAARASLDDGTTKGGGSTKKIGDTFVDQLQRISTNAITATGGVKGLAATFADLGQGLEKALLQLLIIDPVLERVKSALHTADPNDFSDPFAGTQNNASGNGIGRAASTPGGAIAGLGAAIKTLFEPVLHLFGLGSQATGQAASATGNAATMTGSAATATGQAAQALGQSAGAIAGAVGKSGSSGGIGAEIGSAFSSIGSSVGGLAGSVSSLIGTGISDISSFFADGGVVDRPTMFSHSGGKAVAGEAGPEAIMPLKRGPNGQMGVQNHGGSNGSGDVNVVVNNTSQSQVQASHSKSRNGQRNVVLTVSDAMGEQVRNGGELGRSISSTFGGARRPIQR